MLPFTLALRLVAFVFALCASLVIPKGEMLSAAEKKEAVDRLVEELSKSYVFPDVADRMTEAIRTRQRNGEYDKLDDPQAFAQALTEHLQAVSHDKHMRVRSDSGAPAPGSPRRRFPESEDGLRRLNFGFEKVEILPGNVGYIDLRMFAPADLAGPTAAAAMEFLANTDALVLDLRENGGGQPDMVQLFCSYLFGPEPVHLNDLYFRPMNETRQFWTLPSLPGRRYVGKDVYVLTSHTTFSGAEECTYNLQTQKRAQIVGETTGGGANPGGRVELSKHLSAFVPSGRAINPITGTNWEGTGVEPEVRVPAKLALATAHTLALKKLVEGCTEDDRRAELAEALAHVEHDLAALQAETAEARPAAAERH
ncbi:MAG TPA: S41 family peptidase [Planctomycetota bacterium]|jgi:hypothetical protein|nr:S41 family peptidase [Planctomycetota bacterium]